MGKFQGIGTEVEYRQRRSGWERSTMKAMDINSKKTRASRVFLPGILSFSAIFIGCASQPAPSAPAAPTASVTESSSDIGAQEQAASQKQGGPTNEPSNVKEDPMIAKLRQAQARNDAQEIESTARDIIENDIDSPESQQALLALAELAIARGAYREAALYAEASIKHGLTSAEGWYYQAVANYHVKNYDAALDALTSALKADPNYVDAYVMRAEILLSFLDVDRALEAAEKAHKLSPDACKTSVLYGDMLYASRRYGEAIKIYESSESCTKTEALLRNMGKIYEVHVANSQKACQVYRELVEIDPNNANYKASRDYQCN